MKRSLLAGLAVLGLAAGLPAARVSADTTSTTEYTAPAECKQYYIGGLGNPGPARAVHSTQSVTGKPFTGPDCEDVDGVCVTILYPEGGGPGRAVHGHSTQRLMAPAPCTPVDPACAITFDPYGTLEGPARAAHQPSSDVRPRATQPFGILEIPSACQEALVLAFGPTGSETGPTIWIATAFLGAGAVLIVAPRRLARR